MTKRQRRLNAQRLAQSERRDLRAWGRGEPMSPLLRRALQAGRVRGHLTIASVWALRVLA